MSLARSTLVRGPGSAKVGSVVLHSQAGISSDFVAEAVPVAADMWTPLDQFLSAKYATTSLIPVGALSTGLIALLHPYQTPDLGASLLGATDTAFIVHSKAGQKLTFVNHGVWSPPSIRLSATKTAFSGAVQFRHGLKDATEPEAEGAYYALAAEAWTDAAYAALASTVAGGTVTALLGTTPVSSVDGFELGVTHGWQPVPDDNLGIVDWTLDSVAAAISFTPSAGTEAGLLAMMPFANAIGTSVRSGKDFTVSSANGLSMTIYDAFLLQGPLRWGRTTLRQGQLAFAGLVKITADVPGALYNVTFTP